MTWCDRRERTAVADRYVLDTSVAIRWYVDQPGFEHARELRDAGHR